MQPKLQTGQHILQHSYFTNTFFKRGQYSHERMKEIEYEKHDFTARKGRNKRGRRRRQQQSRKRRNIVLQKDSSHIFGQRWRRSPAQSRLQKSGERGGETESRCARVHWTSNKTNMCVGQEGEGAGAAGSRSSPDCVLGNVSHVFDTQSVAQGNQTEKSAIGNMDGT